MKRTPSHPPRTGCDPKTGLGRGPITGALAARPAPKKKPKKHANTGGIFRQEAMQHKQTD